MSTHKQYNYCLDFIKGIACILVVFMHCEFPGILGTAVQAISRFCVPLFFMVSGYFCFNVSESSKSWLKIRHVAKITLFASLFYLAFVLLVELVSHNLEINVSWIKLLIWVMFNEPIVVAGQYWFLFALLYTYIFFFIARRYFDNKVLYIWAALAFIAYYIMAQGAHLGGYHIPNFVYRNWLIEGFAYFMLGHFLHEYQDSISIKNSTLLGIVVVFTILCWPERYLLGRDFGVNVCTLPQVTALMVYAIKNPEKHKGYLQELGKRCSMFVYVLHPAVWRATDGLYHLTGGTENMAIQYIKPILVVAMTIVLSIMCNYFQGKKIIKGNYA